MNDQISATYMAKEKWYNWRRLPLLPKLKTRKEDLHNTSSFNFHWLVFRAWTSDAPMLGIEVNLAENGYFNIRLNLPYLWTGIFIPYYSEWTHRFWRKPPIQRNEIMAKREAKKILARIK